MVVATPCSQSNMLIASSYASIYRPQMPCMWAYSPGDHKTRLCLVDTFRLSAPLFYPARHAQARCAQQPSAAFNLTVRYDTRMLADDLHPVAGTPPACCLPTWHNLESDMLAAL
ncbi:hypothetical protein SVAN01_04946 [Stagonosporopsis vannaccii]|nr:hypothetical protein SVAN01_04946 [Stagonosporopsis vannaccii]